MRKLAAEERRQRPTISPEPGLDTTRGEETLSSLPIAHHFTRPAPSSSLLSFLESTTTPTIPRKPVPGDLQPVGGAVPNDSTTPLTASRGPANEQAARDQIIHSLIADVSRIDIGSAHDEQDLHPEPQSPVGVDVRSDEAPVRFSLDKPLPSKPVKDEGVKTRSLKRLVGKLRPKISRQEIVASPASDKREPSIDGLTYLSRTEDVDVQTRQMPAVIHETIREDICEIQEELISRDIHHHHVFHRILPVHEVEVLPARHYALDQNGKLVELIDQRSDRVVDNSIQQSIANGIQNALPTSDAITGPRQFTARKFQGQDGDYTERLSPDGTVMTERWWVHPPTLEQHGVKSGQTTPFHFGSADPDDDGWRIAKRS